MHEARREVKELRDEAKVLVGRHLREAGAVVVAALEHPPPLRANGV